MSKTVLFVDDSGTMRTIVSQTLQLSKFKVLTGTNGIEGLDLFKSNTVDLVISDINMPGMDGITFLKELRKLNKEVPVLILTTESKDDLKQEAFSLGANGWVVKPFKPTQFLSLINEIFS
jgi:two-component system, chemotaxis family, chemotaxis protein CheY